MKTKLLSLFFLFSMMNIHAQIYNVRDYGAKGDSLNIDSEAIKDAIKAALSKGGGTVYFPAGKYLCYSIELKSNISLNLDKGCSIVAAYPGKGQGYDPAEKNEFSRYQDFGHSHWKNSLIWGIGLNNLSIGGEGIIDGAGLTREADETPGIGNKAISLKNCNRVKISGISMLHCGHFAILATAVDNLIIDKLLIDTNRDGIDIDCCKNVKIYACSVNSPWDDAIVLKSSYALGYFRDTEDVVVSDCFVSGFDRGTLYEGTLKKEDPQAPDHFYSTGRIKLGTESSGGFKNIAITNCLFERCRGLALETVDGGSLEDIVIDNITMRNIVNSPIFIRLGARQRSPGGTPVGKISRVNISNINVYDADSRYSCIISGIPGHYIEDVNLSNIHIVYKGGYKKEDGHISPPEKEDSYPEPSMFGTVPASGFFIRHAKNIELRNIKISFSRPDLRPSIWMKDVYNCRLTDYDTDSSPKAYLLNKTYNTQGISSE